MCAGLYNMCIVMYITCSSSVGEGVGGGGCIYSNVCVRACVRACVLLIISLCLYGFVFFIHSTHARVIGAGVPEVGGDEGCRGT